MVASNIDLKQMKRGPFPGRLFIPAPWEKAESFCDRLRKHGIAATACYQAADHTAGLEVPEQVDLDAVNRILEGPSP